MGTIIHPFIEYDISVENESPFCPAPDGHVEIRAFNTGEFFTFSDYELFDALAFGRSFDMGGRADGKRPLYPPRGLPANVTRTVLLRYYHVVADPDYQKNRFDPTVYWYGSLPSVSRQEALDWVSQGWSQWGNNLRESPPSRTPISFDLVSNPNWRNPSWLTHNEILKSLNHFQLEVELVPPEFQVILDAMLGLEKHYGTGKTRLVFWFSS